MSLLKAAAEETTVKASAWSERCVGRAPLSIPPGWQGLPIDTFVIPTQFERGRRY
jgi:hypothetical protein